MKKFNKAMFCAMALAMCVGTMSTLAACSNSNSSSSTAPANFTFNTTDGTFSFDAVANAETYLVGVSKVLNDTTGKALQSVNGAVSMTKTDGSTCYIWSEQSGSCTGLADNDNDGKVTGTVVFREYSSSAMTVGNVLTMDKIPLGHYIVQAMAASNDKLTNPEPALFEFTMGGTLATPSGFTAQINSDGYMEITAPSSYYLSCLTVTGMPAKMKFEIMDGTTSVETIDMDDFSYTNTVNGPNKAYTFNNSTVTGTTKLDSSKKYTVTVTAVGDGDQIKDASSTAYMATTTAATEFATKYDTSASATCGDYSLAITLGLDAGGNNIYELTASVNSVVILRESGTYTTAGVIETLDNLNTYGEGTAITFTSKQTDASASVLDGKTLTVAKGASMGGGFPPTTKTTYDLTGTGLSLDGTLFDFTPSEAKMGGFPG
ncbi:MAG TPA: hypothetical protein VN258_04815 [Mobilitalea sp.]|nr:hypothetical protein [Mobilitalea sp.]